MKSHTKRTEAHKKFARIDEIIRTTRRSTTYNKLPKQRRQEKNIVLEIVGGFKYQRAQVTAEFTCSRHQLAQKKRDE